MKSNTLYHTDELFRLINAKLKMAGLLPNILDENRCENGVLGVSLIGWHSVWVG